MNVGDSVIINLNPDEQIKTTKEVWEYQGCEATITRKRIVKYGRGKTTRGTYYELEGVESRMHVPFCFLEEMLIPAID